MRGLGKGERRRTGALTTVSATTVISVTLTWDRAVSVAQIDNQVDEHVTGDADNEKDAGHDG